MKYQKVGEIYKCVHGWIIRKAEINPYTDVIILDKQDIMVLLGELFHIPKESRGKVLSELVDYGMIKQISRGRAGIKYQILG